MREKNDTRCSSFECGHQDELRISYHYEESDERIAVLKIVHRIVHENFEFIVATLGGYENKNPRNHKDYEGLFPNEWTIVEPERIELSSREDNTVLSTCLVDFKLWGKVRQATA